MLRLLVITFDMFLIEFMQSAQLTFNGRIITEFFAALFLFPYCEKERNLPKYLQTVICWDLFLYLLGFLVFKTDIDHPHYTALKIYT